MQVDVKKPRIRLEGDINLELVPYLRETYGDVEVIEDEDEEPVEITKSEWYHNIRSEISPSENIRLYRELHNMSQTELGEKLGRFSRQNISNMENGQRDISKSLAKRLSKLFDGSVEKFI